MDTRPDAFRKGRFPRFPALSRLGGAGAAAYDRRRMLPRLLPLAPDDLAGPEPATGRRLCRLILRAMRAERSRGRAGHRSYDLNRHIGLMQALKAERAALSGFADGPVAPPRRPGPRPPPRAVDRSRPDDCTSSLTAL